MLFGTLPNVYAEKKTKTLGKPQAQLEAQVLINKLA